ncbi:pleiotropic drug resistance protein 1 isoform X3 [Rosa chinensis]|uniref:pleiotropic drug resistance protein 1 isoform X3 n=1 Tax=Rosa chinensis TaxID=74649 RepID=UPI001AD8B7D2|nr:pleiotropic drug resistance protein 1 isoform X3 [Rosa chinensis]
MSKLKTLMFFIKNEKAMNITFSQEQEEEEIIEPPSGEGADEESSLTMTTYWSAVERLPTYSRTRRGILLGQGQEEDGESREIDIKKNLGLRERKTLLERLVQTVEQDNEKLLRKIKDRMNRVGLEFPTTEVRFEHLNVEAEAYVGTRASSPTVFNFSINMLEGFLNCFHILPSKKRAFPILHDVSGSIKPRRMTLLLGPPGSGKTTFLLALAGKLGKANLKFSGRVTYNGSEMDEFVSDRMSAYVTQHDLHIPELTVRETLAFAARCQGVGPRYEMLVELLRREKAANIMPDLDLDLYMKAAALEGQEANIVTDFILKILGLEDCADIMVGDEMTRGISGGQKKRLTTGEMLVGPERVLLMDEISNGLDSSTTLQLVKSLQQYVHILNGTALIALLQPAPETYNLFDDIILLSDGYIVYQGPRENVLEFFEYMGFKCPERKGVADFLQEVTSRKDQEQYWAHRDRPYRFVTTKAFSEAMQLFHIGRKVGDELSIPFNKSEGHPAALSTKKYGVNKKELFKVCMARQILLTKRNSFVYIFKLVQLILVALTTMTLFLRTEMHQNTVADGGIYMGALFYTLLAIMLNGFPELHMTVTRLPVFFKQRDHLFYPAWAYSLPTWMIRIPITFVDVSIWVIITYYPIGYDPSIERFFKQFLLLLCISQMANGLFRLIGALGRNMTIANTFGFGALLVILGLGGFVISQEDMKKWLLWGYWLSPFTYGLNAIAVNEFLGESWRHVPANSTEALGVMVLKYRGIFPEARFYWIGLVALIGFILLLNFLFTLALQYLDPLEMPQAVLSNEASSTTEDSRVASNPTRQHGMVLPFEPLSITFEEIRYAVDLPKEMKDQSKTGDRLELLKGVSGAFRPGVLTALMGVSGAGKTTLMDVLAGRKTSGYIEGRITLSGYAKRQETFARISGYCEQTDIHSPHVTVYESLVYSAWLRLPREVDSPTRKMFIEEVMELVEMASISDRFVGFPGVNGLSTEQRKRLTIAVELVANPSIIFMDEPTSGLDARAAAIVMRTVRNTVDTGRTVVCTIHQPSIDIFDAFDEMLLLKRGGEEIYVGPLGHHSSQMIEYFEEICGVSKIKDGYNPATWMLEVTSPAQEASLGVDFAYIYKNSEIFRKNKALIKELSTPAPNSKDLYFPTRYSQSFFTQCLACLWKQHVSYWRNPQYTAVRLLFTATMAALLGSFFWDLGSKRQKQRDLFSALGSMYAAVLFIGIQNSLSVQPVVHVERLVSYRETAAGMYSAFPFAFGQAVIEIPYTLIQTIIYGVIVYSMVGFDWTVSKFFFYLLFMYLTFLYFTFHGMMIVSITPSNTMSAVVSSAFYPLWNVISGFLIPKTRIPIWWRWFYWVSPTSWSLYGLFSSQFGGLKDTLDSGETVDHFISTYFGYRKDFLGVVVAVLIGFSAFFVFIFAFAIKKLNFQKR